MWKIRIKNLLKKERIFLKTDYTPNKLIKGSTHKLLLIKKHKQESRQRREIKDGKKRRKNNWSHTNLNKKKKNIFTFTIYIRGYNSNQADCC